jgi:hypothetical protein
MQEAYCSKLLRWCGSTTALTGHKLSAAIVRFLLVTYPVSSRGHVLHKPPRCLARRGVLCLDLCAVREWLPYIDGQTRVAGTIIDIGPHRASRLKWIRKPAMCSTLPTNG